MVDKDRKSLLNKKKYWTFFTIYSMSGLIDLLSYF